MRRKTCDPVSWTFLYIMSTKLRITFVCLLLAVFVFFIFQGVIYIYSEVKNSQLASALAIELTAVKQWQQRTGMRRNVLPGERGEDVRLLQQALKNNPAIYPNQEITGFYGDSTVENVKKFQEQNGLAPIGTVDDATRIKVNEKYFSEFCKSDSDKRFPDLRFKKVDRNTALPEGYFPRTLSDITYRVRSVGISCLDSEAADSIEKMFKDAESEGVILAVSSSFRRPEIQGLLYTFWHNMKGDQSISEVAAPGHSEHQLGTAVDLTGESIGYQSVSPRFAHTREGRWLEAHAYQYGFVMSYPKNQTAVTGYAYEPWHYRYVGQGIAQEVYTTKETLQEYFTKREQSGNLTFN